MPVNFLVIGIHVLKMRKIEWKHFYRGFCAFLFISLSTGIFSFCWIDFVRENNQTGHLLGLGNIAMAILLYAGIFLFIGKMIGAFRIGGGERKSAVMASEVLTALVVNVIEIFLSMAITGQFRFFFDFLKIYAFLFVVQTLLLSLLVIPMINIYRKLFPPQGLLEIYGDKANNVSEKMNGMTYKYHIVDRLHYSVGIEEIKKHIDSVDAVLVSDIPSHEKNLILKHCVQLDKRVYFIPKISDVIVRYSEGLNLIDTPLFLRRRIGLGFAESIIKRVFDIVMSIFALIVTSPIFLVTAIAIKIEDGGPVFFKQERATLGGKSFMIIKFRSMIVDAEKDGRPHPATEKDDRITKVGRIIRSVRIDELPQFINILKGEMSIVGPRPERCEHVKKYTEMIEEFTLRTKVKGGLTGYAQVYGKYNTTALDKLKMDIIYIMNFSLLLDLQIIFETIKILFRKEKTEGFSEERAREMRESEAE